LSPARPLLSFLEGQIMCCRTIEHSVFLGLVGLFAIVARPCHAAEWLDVRSWVYQLTNYPHGRLDELVAADFDLAVVDLARDGGEDFFTAKEIGALKESGKITLAYFEIGAIEDFRPEWKLVPEDLKAGPVEGWENEQYVRFWDQRWWPIVKGRVDQAITAGYDGAYLDLITAYEEIPKTGLDSEERAKRMVDLIDRVSKYAKSKQRTFKIVAQNCPELYTWSYWEPKPNQVYLRAIDGIAIESVFYLAHDKPANKGWCQENRQNATAIRSAGKLALGVDYAKKTKSIADAYKRQREIGFVPYVSVVALNKIIPEPK
jgi:cysteinyl-tRNA synthetase